MESNQKTPLIKELRGITGISITLCKKILERNNWDIDAALADLKSQGTLDITRPKGTTMPYTLIFCRDLEDEYFVSYIKSSDDFLIRSDTIMANLKTLSVTPRDELDQTIKEMEHSILSTSLVLIKIGYYLLSKSSTSAIYLHNQRDGYASALSFIDVILANNDYSAKQLAIHTCSVALGMKGDVIIDVNSLLKTPFLYNVNILAESIVVKVNNYLYV